MGLYNNVRQVQGQLVHMDTWKLEIRQHVGLLQLDAVNCATKGHCPRKSLGPGGRTTWQTARVKSEATCRASNRKRGQQQQHHHPQPNQPFLNSHNICCLSMLLSGVIPWVTDTRQWNMSESRPLTKSERGWRMTLKKEWLPEGLIRAEPLVDV